MPKRFVSDCVSSFFQDAAGILDCAVNAGRDTESPDVAILVEAALSFLGLGIRPPTPSWGLMISEGRKFMFFQPYLVAIPGEGFHAVEAHVRARHDDPLLLAGLAPDWHGYLPRPYTDGYEEGLSLGPTAVAQLVDAL